MDKYRRRGSNVCQLVVILTCALVHCICLANAWPSELGYSKVVVHSPSTKKEVLPDPTRVHQARELSAAESIWFPRTFNLTMHPANASDRSDTSRSFQSGASQPRIVYGVSHDRDANGFRDKEYEPYVAPPGLNSFPPNSNIDYNNPQNEENTDPNSSYLPTASGPVEPTIRDENHDSKSSYLPPASGPVESTIPTESHDSKSSYLPPASGPVQSTIPSEFHDSISSYLPPASGPVDVIPSQPHHVLPQTNYGPPPIITNMRPFKEQAKSPAPQPIMKPTLPYPPPFSHSPPSHPIHDYPMDYSHEHHFSDHPDDSSSEYLDHPPPGYEPDQPTSGKHSHHASGHPSSSTFHHDSHEYLGDHGVDVYPEVIIDHYPDHEHDDIAAFHHDHPDHPYPLPPPPPPPPPPPHADVIVPETPRVKKYSYFYLGRHLWYVPLYFTVWFTFYVAYLIIQSIGRHKVDLPNHTRVRRSARDMSHKATVEKVDSLTQFVMQQIAGFPEKQH